jgi:predicted AAA+ superfamily ATPase
MYPRILEPPTRQSFFLFGPRGVGKTAWVHARVADALVFDLLDSETYTRLLAAPSRLADLIPAAFSGWVVVDEIQRVPELLNEIHRLIEGRRLKFVLTGSSARKLRRRGVNLLAGRALTRFLHPLVATELGPDFDVVRALQYGGLPFACTEPDPRDYLTSYVDTYLREEVQQEGFTRNLAAFARFLEAASFSQGAVLNMAAVARESAVDAKVVADYFTILEDLLIAVRLPVFAKRARRRVVAHPKFYFFDAGVYRTIRPKGPLDAPEEMTGPALETLVLHHLRALNDYLGLGYAISYWRTTAGDEVDFVLYGSRGLVAVEAKMTSRVRPDDLRGLRRFREVYPQARAFLVYGGTRRWREADIEILPTAEALRSLPELIA